MAADRIVIAGASGFVGRALVRELAHAGYETVALSRDPEAARRRLPEGIVIAGWDGRTAGDWAIAVDGASAVINLAGDSLAKGRWKEGKKRRILESRIGAGAALVEAVRRARAKPDVLVQASAVGFYGSPGEMEVDESLPAGVGFLSEVARQWEASTREIEALGVRRVVVRSGLVLGAGGGAWPSLVGPFRLLAGGPLGSGRQWVSWISLDDEVRAIRFLVEHPGLAGTFNLVAPCPLRQRELCRAIGRAMRRPCWLPVPAVLLRALFGEKAGETLLVSQRVVPKRLTAAGFEFRYAAAGAAIAALVRGGPLAGSVAG
jgi:uncharacterized protein (TIGR01777 family)